MKSAPMELTLKYTLTEFFREILFLEFWWYSTGLVEAFHWCVKSVKSAARITGLSIWTQNLFVPMYGETELVGKLISFGVRFVMVMARGFLTGFWVILSIVLFALYLFVLPLSLFGIVYGIFTMFVV